jgi:hypothetical protein
MSNERFLEKTHSPKEVEILTALGSTNQLWLGVHNYIQEHYEFSSEFIFFTKKYGWSIRYKNGKKTACYFFPEFDSFSILIVLGIKESQQIESIKDRLNKPVKSVFDNTEQFHDGRWLWIRVIENSDIDSFKLLLSTKIKPNK